MDDPGDDEGYTVAESRANAFSVHRGPACGCEMCVQDFGLDFGFGEDDPICPHCGGIDAHSEGCPRACNCDDCSLDYCECECHQGQQDDPAMAEPDLEPF